jgi:hypothetical protein
VQAEETVQKEWCDADGRCQDNERSIRWPAVTKMFMLTTRSQHEGENVTAALTSRSLTVSVVWATRKGNRSGSSRP